MKKLIYIFLLLVVSSSLNSQTVERFKSDFSKIDTNTFDEDSRFYFFKLYNSDLTPFGFRSDLEYRKFKYPYSELLNDSTYKKRIEDFFYSENEELRELSYYTISAVGDKSYEKRMVDRLISESENSKFQLCVALMHLETDRTSIIFDYILQNKLLNEILLQIPLYQRLDNDSLRNTAYQHFYNENPEARDLAYLFLKETELNEKTEMLLKQAVVSVDVNDKIKIVEVIKELQVGNLKEVLIPLLDSSKTRKVSLQALANSPTKSDSQVIIDLINSKDTLDNDLLYSLMSSKNIESNKLWLKVIQTHHVPSLYYPNLHHRGVYHSDELLPLVQEAIINTDNTEILSELIEVLGSREDEKSLNLVFDAMRHEDLKVRESATRCLRWNSSELIKEQVESILYDSNVRTEEIVYLAIKHNFNTYHNFFENLFKESDDLFWRRASIKYLSVFPLEKHQQLFESLLEVIKVCKSHEEGREWYNKKNILLPNNCMVKDNPPNIFQKTGGTFKNQKEIKEFLLLNEKEKNVKGIKRVCAWNKHYQKRADEFPQFNITKPIYKELENPIQILREDLIDWFGKVPTTQTPKIITEAQFEKLKNKVKPATNIFKNGNNR